MKNAFEKLFGAICIMVLLACAWVAVSPIVAQLPITQPVSVASSRPQTTFAYGERAFSTNVHFAIVTANGVGVPRVQYVNFNSDKSTANLKFYNVTNYVIVTNVGASVGTNVFLTTVPAAIYFTNTTILIYQHITNDFYERLTWSNSDAVSITVSTTSAQGPGLGDRIYQVGVGGQIPFAGTAVGTVGSNTFINANAGALWNGKAGVPLLIEIDNNTNGALNAVSGVFTP